LYSLEVWNRVGGLSSVIALACFVHPEPLQTLETNIFSANLAIVTWRTSDAFEASFGVVVDRGQTIIFNANVISWIEHFGVYFLGCA
jgi:hypothetical protein